MTEKVKIPSLDTLKWVHIVGVCGTLMGSFAAYLKRRGIRVTGSDQNVYPPMSDVLRNAGVELFNSYDPQNLTNDKNQNSKQKPDLVVIGNVIRSSNPEARKAIDSGFTYSSLPEAMETLFLKNTRNLVVAGTHGKTTASSLLAHVLMTQKKDPNYFIGGVPYDLPFSFHVANLDPGSFFVLEGDEYDTAFWDKVPKFNHYLPDDVLLTSIEYDHADIYPDIQAVVRAFEGLVSRVRTGGRMIACFDYPLIQTLVEHAPFSVLSYGTLPGSQARFTLGKVGVEDGLSRFEILDRGKKRDELCLQIPGIHNAANALAVWIECQELGLASPTLHHSFQSFRGVKRRQEVKGEVEGVMVIDDFAHHPTAVRETLRALRSKYPTRRLVTLFEPRSATSRRKIFQNDYAAAFQEADVIFIANPYDQTQIAKENQFSSQMLIDDLKNAGKESHLMESVDIGVDQVVQLARSGDLIAVLSNGGFDGLILKLLEALKKIQT